MDAKTVLQLERQKHTFNGVAVAEIRRGLVLGLVALAEVDRIRGMAETDRLLGKPWAAGTVPVEPAEHSLSEIANALLWVTPEVDPA